MGREELRSLKGAPLVKKYEDRNGVKRCVGIKDRLKASQLPGALFGKRFMGFCSCVLIYLYIYDKYIYIYMDCM